MQKHIIIILFLYIAAQQAENETQAAPVGAALCAVVVDAMLRIWTGKGIIQHIKS